MNELTDHQLLAAWAGRRDDQAFRSLVGRYGGFVYAAALRRVADKGLAEEITQDVFARLSQNASGLASHPTISGWLHRATMLLALDRLRRRRRQARTLERFAQMNETPERDPWVDVGRHLDESLDRLSTAEREVLMLHYAERQTFLEIAKRKGSTPDAVRMRANRALASLSRLLGKKGAAMPASALAAGLGGAFTQSAPASVAAITPAVLTGLGGVSPVSVLLHTFQTINGTKALGTAACAIVLAVPLWVQQEQISSAEKRVAALQSAKPSEPSIAPGSGILPARIAATQRDAPSFDLKRMGEDALAGDFFANRRLDDAIKRLDNNNLAGLIETAMHGGLMPATREALMQKLLREMRGRDLRLFVEWSLKVIAGTVPASSIRSDYAYTLRTNLKKGFRDWVASDPARATEWAEEHRDEWNAQERSSLRTLTISGLLHADPSRAYGMLESSSVKECMDVMQQVPGELKPEETNALTHWAASLQDEDKRRRMIRKALVGSKFSRPEGMTLLASIQPPLMELNLSTEDLTWVAVRLAVDSVLNISSDLKTNYEKELQWLESVVPPERLDYAKGSAGHLYQPRQALIYLNSQLDLAPNDDLIAGYVESPDLRWHRDYMLTPSGGQHGETAFLLATRVQDPERRQALLLRAWNDLFSDNAKAARDILNTPELQAEDRSALEPKIATQLAKRP